MNKAAEVRKALGLTPTEAGRLIIGIEDGKKAYDMWSRWEATGKWSLAANQYLGILLLLIVARDMNKPASCGAIRLILEAEKRV